MKGNNKVFILASTAITILFLTQIFPPLWVLDSTSLKHFFFSVTLLGVLSFLSFFSLKGEISFNTRLLNNRITISWFILLSFMLISFLQAINVPESILTLNRWVIILILYLVLSLLIENKPRLFQTILTLSLIIATFNVLSCILPYYYFEVYSNPRKNLYLNGFYGNKNIFAAAILFKLPFLYYIVFFRKKALRIFALILIFSLSFTLVILSARTSFLGLIMQGVILIGFITYYHLKHKPNIKLIKPSIIILLAIGSGLLAGDGFVKFNFEHFARHSKAAEVYNFDTNNYTVASRLRSIEEGNSKGRLIIWKNTIEIIKSKPILGYGVGNHKVAIMKVEAKKKPNFVVSDHAHNDYLEMFSELGIFGLLSYLFLFLSSGILFLKTQIKKRIRTNSRFISLTGFLGMVTYMNDAMFNFPLERADMQLYLSLSLSLILIAYLRETKQDTNPTKLPFYILLLIIIPVTLLETMHFTSSIMQKEKILHTNGNKRINYTAEQWARRFPPIPTLDESTNPIALTIGMRFDIEKKYRQAIDIIINDKSNPYYGLREYRLSNYYLKLGKLDSAEFYARQCIEMKPLCYDPVRTLYYKYRNLKEYNTAEAIIDNFLKRYKDEPKAWIDIIDINKRKKDLRKMGILLDSALFYHPDNKELLQFQAELSGISN
ncbi:MAG: O-antigen ligase family protein [Bacteroidales bacterium]